jgi:Asp-tRNA(Asn)/Glu-tRNA(Gln) amidotransferase A subunit family amidase
VVQRKRREGSVDFAFRARIQSDEVASCGTRESFASLVSDPADGKLTATVLRTMRRLVLNSPGVSTFNAVIGSKRFELLQELVPNAAVMALLVNPNYLELCAITLPVGQDKAGMPVGLQLIAPSWAEEKLFAIALAVERVLGTATERFGTPPLLS